MPQNLLQPIKDFEDQFTVDRAKLKQIVAHFVKELEKGTSPPYWKNPVIPQQPGTNSSQTTGLTVEGGNIVRIHDSL